MKEIRWLLNPYVKYGKLYLIISILFAAIILPLDSVLQVYFPQAVLNLLSSHKNFLVIVLTAIGFESVFLLITLLDDLFNNAYKEAVSVRIRANINREIYEQCCKTRYDYVDTPDYYDKFSWAIKEYANKSTETVGFIVSSLTLIITIASLITIIATSIWWVIIIMATSFALKSLVVAKVNKLDMQKDEEIIPIDRKIAYFHSVFYQKSYAAELRTTKLKSIILAHYEEEIQNKIHLIRKYIVKTLYLLIINDLLVRIADVFIIIGIAGSIYNGKVSEVGAYMTLLLAANKLNDLFYQIFDIFHTGNKLEKYGGNIHKFFCYQTEKTDGIGVLTDRPFEVEFKNVSFSYPNSSFALRDISFRITAGERVAIVGENGAGKSTIVKLLLRLYDVQSGEILINGVNINDYNLFELRNAIGVAFQNTNIYAFSLDENIGLYDNSTEKAITEAKKAFGLDLIVAKNGASNNSTLTREFDDNGIVLSGGEAQKVAVARTTTKKFSLLMLDEPSAALDPMAEYNLNQSLFKRSKETTTIMIAHRLSSVRNMDKILVINNGELMESGTHDELMRVQGLYSEMFLKQAENYQI